MRDLDGFDRVVNLAHHDPRPGVFFGRKGPIGVALWGGEGPEEVRKALSRPHFTLYLGRKSCPLSAPTAPKVIQAATPPEALARIELPPFLAGELDPERPLMVVSEEPLDGGRQEIRWDEPLDRASWHFGPRTVHVARPHESGTHE